MITSLRLVNFKNFADETLRLGPFTVIVGANASGKSNIRDAFRFLHGIGRGYTLADILGGKYGEGGQREWDGIRGAPNEIARLRKTYAHESSSFMVHLKLTLLEQTTSYLIKVGFNSASGFVVLREELETESATIYRTVTSAEYEGVIDPKREQYHWVWQANPPMAGQPIGGKAQVQPVLTQVFPDGLLGDFLSTLGNMHFLELSPERMREPSVPGATILGDSGQNLPSVLESVCADFRRKTPLISWLQELTPMDVSGLEFPRDPSGRVHLRIVEQDGRSISAYSASDGTLRFLAMLAALLSPNPAGVYFFEEIDNGIHPNRLWLLLDLIEKQTAKNRTQVITTTHSPDVLNLINDKTFENTSTVSRLEDNDDAIIRPVDSLPNARKLRNAQGLGRLHTSGWMEDMVNLTAWRDTDGEARE